MKDKKTFNEKEIDEIFGGKYEKTKPHKMKKASDFTICPNCGYYDGKGKIED